MSVKQALNCLNLRQTLLKLDLLFWFSLWHVCDRSNIRLTKDQALVRRLWLTTISAGLLAHSAAPLLSLGSTSTIIILLEARHCSLLARRFLSLWVWYWPLYSKILCCVHSLNLPLFGSMSLLLCRTDCISLCVHSCNLFDLHFTSKHPLPEELHTFTI